MEKKVVRTKMKGITLLLLALMVISMMLLGTRVLPAISLGADMQELVVEANLEKYMNYHISDSEQGTLVQYRVKQKIIEGENYIPIKQSEIEIQFNQIDGKYPEQVKTITKATSVTNGKTEGIEENYEYDKQTGRVTIKAENEDYQEVPSQEASDEYLVICYYDTYIEENLERDVSIEVSAKATLAIEEAQIDVNETFEIIVTEKIEDLISVIHQPEIIYNGNIKSNLIHGTSYNTTYQEKEEIVISKKEALEKLELVENNTFIKEENKNLVDLGNNNNLIYKSTKIKKENLEKVLGENGKIEILDQEGNTSVTIDLSNTEWEEDGSFTIYYEQEPETLLWKTSEIQNEGILMLEHTKEIKSSMTEETNVKVQTISQVSGNQVENIIDIQDAKTNVTFQANHKEWSNEQQNEVTFDLSFNANSAKDNMLKNPSLRIEMPSQVEKVIIQNSNIFYGNGMELQETYTETNADGNIVIVANLVGTQTEYRDHKIDLSTDVKIVATIILKKDIERAEENVYLHYTNEYSLDGNHEVGTQEMKVQIDNYQEAKEEIKAEPEYNLATSTQESQENLQLEVAPVKGDVTINDGDTIYEAEFIKYNMKVTNTSDKKIDNVKIVANVPEGTTYGKLRADYHTFEGYYEYILDEEQETVEMNIGSLEPGESISKFYEVKANYLPEGETQKEIEFYANMYVGETLASEYQLHNQIEKSETGVFLTVSPYVQKDEWFYCLKLSGEKEIVEEKEIDPETGEEITIKDMDNYKEVNVTLKFPKEYKPSIMDVKSGYGEDITFSENDIAEDGTMNLKLYTNSSYLFDGFVDRSKVTETPKSEEDLIAVATVEKDGKTYKSNENRLRYMYENVSVSIESDNEGEEVNYNDEINYTIKVTNTGKTNLNYVENSRLYVDIQDFLPKEVRPISAEYDNWEQLPDDNTDPTPEITTEYTNKGLIFRQLAEDTKTDENGKELPNLNLGSVLIPYGETETITVKTKAKKVSEKTQIENKVEVSGEYLTAKTSNTITHTILPYEEPEQPEKPDPDPEKPDPEKPDPEEPDPDNPNPEDPSDTYHITGVAWLDENEDGERQTSEKLLSEIPVMLFDANDMTKAKETVQTNGKGEYNFSGLKQGDYFVFFLYDVNQYHVTEYQKKGVSNNYNSDAISKNMELEGKNKTVGIIDATNLKSTLANMDIGLIENKICDLKLDKSISKVTVSTAKGTKQYTYNNEKLAKIEIRAKEIEGATVVIEYKIVVTNEGELATTVGKVVDYLPDGLSFSSELNQDWSAQTGGQIVNNSMAKQKLQPGESLELKLIATKRMNAENTGSFINGAEIGEISNELNISDIDSKPGNRVKSEDDYSEASIIISVSTGAIVYISIGFITIGMIGIGIFLAHKNGKSKLGKLSVFAGLFVTIVATIQLTSIGEYFESSYPKDHIQGGSYNSTQEVGDFATFNWVPDSPIKNEFGSIYFSGGPSGDGGYCVNPGKKAYSGSYRKGGSSVTRTVKNAHEDDISFTITAEGVPITFNATESTYTYGPMTLVSSANCDSCTIDYGVGTMPLTVKKGSNTFSITIPASQGPITKVTATVTKKGMRTETTFKYGNTTWHPTAPNYTYQEREYYWTTNDKGEEVRKSRMVTKNGTYQSVTTKNNLVGKSINVYQISNTQTCTWTPSNTSILVLKEDYDNPKKVMQNVSFNGPKGGGTTGSDGKFFIQDLPSSVNYTLTETVNPNYGYIPESSGTVYGKPGELSRITIKNIKHTGNLKIIKKDLDNSSLKLKDIGYKIRNSKGQYLIAVDDNGVVQKSPSGRIYLGNLKYTTDPSQATEFKTDVNGIIEIINIWEGDYTVEETSTGKYEAYDIDDKYISWSAQTKGTSRYAKVTVTRQTSLNTERPTMTTLYANTLTVYNRRKYIKISGKAWNDIEEKGKSEQDRNALYGDSTDRDLEGILVQLIDMRTGQVVKHDHTGVPIQATTAKDGTYLFEDVIIDELQYYKVEFQYNGMSYRNSLQRADKYPLQYAEVTGSDKQEKKSRAEVRNSCRVAEGENRPIFNNSYAVISYQKSNQYDLTYKTADYESEILFRKDKDESKYNYGYSGGEDNRGPVNGIDDQYIIRANTFYTYGGGLTKIKTEDEIRKNAILEIADINLGIEKRAQPDLSLAKDIKSVKVSINGAIHVYNYDDRFNPALFAENGGNPFDVQPSLKFGTKYGDMSYTRALYSSDVYYEDVDPDNKLRVKVTYKIGIKNTSDTLTSIVNEIEDYYDSKYYNLAERVNVGKEIDSNGDIIDASKLNYDFEDSGNGEYYKIRIKGMNVVVQPQSNEYIYVQLEVKQDQIVEILSPVDKKLDNIAEISSYTTIGKEGYYDGAYQGIYAGIDQDSQPGNIEIDKPTTYEDDTDKAPGLQLILQEERKMDGIVFIDQTTGELQSGKIREGDGTYKAEENESVVPEVSVKLVRKDNWHTIVDRYDESLRAWVPAETKTDQNGEYYIGGYIPDEYKVVYTWGGQTYIDGNGDQKLIRVQDYKGTIYKEKDRQYDLEWYKQRQPRYSDAMDNYDEAQELPSGSRQQIDEQSAVSTNANIQTVNNYNGEMELRDGTKQPLRTKIDSITPTFRVNVEYSTAPTYYKDEYELNNGVLQMNGSYLVKKDEYKNYLQHVDLGIVERARQAVSVEKRIGRIKHILANGMVLIDAEVIEDPVTGERKLNDMTKYAVYIPNSQGANGQIKFELDTELAHGSRIEVYYNMVASNISELDYLTDDYYKYGSGYGEDNEKLVTITPSTLVDYLDTTLSTDGKEKDIKGEILVDYEEKRKLIDELGLLENTEEMDKWIKTSNKSLIVIKGFEDEKLRPIGTPNAKTEAEIVLTAYKVLGQNDDFVAGNELEIVKTEKSGGASLVTVLGNYIPSVSVEEFDDSTSEDIVIIPPTGLSQEEITNHNYIVIAITAGAILAGGIILIKKFLLK